MLRILSLEPDWWEKTHRDVVSTRAPLGPAVVTRQPKTISVNLVAPPELTGPKCAKDQSNRTYQLHTRRMTSKTEAEIGSYIEAPHIPSSRIKRLLLLGRPIAELRKETANPPLRSDEILIYPLGVPV
ncbi:hypothetical protein N7513_011796 [Penicillium frequentans]|nr:hypothetical protein N7513_011796 [Penicillium glabrum]